MFAFIQLQIYSSYGQGYFRASVNFTSELINNEAGYLFDGMCCAHAGACSDSNAANCRYFAIACIEQGTRYLPFLNFWSKCNSTLHRKLHHTRSQPVLRMEWSPHQVEQQLQISGRGSDCSHCRPSFRFWLQLKFAVCSRNPPPEDVKLNLVSSDCSQTPRIRSWTWSAVTAVGPPRMWSWTHFRLSSL